MTSLLLLFLLECHDCYASPLQPQATSTSNTAPTKNDTAIVDFVDKHGRVGLLWSSIGLAILTSLLQGAVTTLVAITEVQSMWTFRFRIAKFEHWWWTGISTMLSVSFGLIGISFLAGNGNDSIGVLVLSTATTIAIVRYAIPAWRNRHFIQSRWLAWTGPSRTTIDGKWAGAGGDAAHWKVLSRQANIKTAPPPSDDYGFALLGKPKNMIEEDPTAILKALKTVTPTSNYHPERNPGPSVFDDGFTSSDGDSVSLLWGTDEGFLRRVSRAVNSVPKPLLASRPYTVDGYNGEGLMLAMGVLGRNKGLLPKELVYDFNDRMKQSRGIKRNKVNIAISSVLEQESSFAPRPNKVMRSYYYKAMEEQYGGLPKAYIAAATELALIMLDCSPGVKHGWLKQGLEQQSMEVNGLMSRPRHYGHPKSPVATPEELRTLYRAKEVSTIISLNHFPDEKKQLHRPDLHCFALLRLAEGAVQFDGQTYKRGAGASMPQWWKENWVQTKLREEDSSLSGGWRQPAAWLLGLSEYPAGLDNRGEWPEVIYEPDVALMKQKNE